jgi:hypothetical protein
MYSLYTFLNRRLKEADFKLTKPSTDQGYNTPRAHTRTLLGYQLTIQADSRAKRHLNKRRTTTLNKEKLEALRSSSRTIEEQKLPPVNTTRIPPTDYPSADTGTCDH